jgi:hypothetical protein
MKRSHSKWPGDAGTGPATGFPLGLLLVYIIIFASANLPYQFMILGDTLSGLFGGSPTEAFVNRDMVNYWFAPKLALSGDIGVLADQVVYQRALESEFSIGTLEPRSWSYPPHFLLLVAPLAYLDYRSAYAVFQLVTLGLFVISAFCAFWQHGGRQPVDRPRIPAALWLLMVPYAVSQFGFGQNGFLFGAMMIFALALRNRHPLATGLALAVLTMKPQLGVLFPFLLLAERNYRAIFWATGFSLLLLTVSIAAFGVESWLMYFSQTIPYQKFVMFGWYGAFLYVMPTLFAALRTVGVSPEIALAVHAIIALPVAAIAVFGFFRLKHEFQRAALLVVATFLVSPYSFTYDAGPLFLYACLIFLWPLTFLPEPAAAAHALTRRYSAKMFVLAFVLAMPLAMPLNLIAANNSSSVLGFIELLAPLSIAAFLVILLRDSGLVPRRES